MESLRHQNWITFWRSRSLRASSNAFRRLRSGSFSEPRQGFIHDLQRADMIAFDSFIVNRRAFIRRHAERRRLNQFHANGEGAFVFTRTSINNRKTLRRPGTGRFGQPSGARHFVQGPASFPVRSIFENSRERIEVQRIVERRRFRRHSIACAYGQCRQGNNVVDVVGEYDSECRYAELEP